MKCEWCETDGAEEVNTTVYWELPDGTRAIEITETPGISCSACGMEYQADETVRELEDQLFLVDTSKIDKTIVYKELMELPRLLKRNYFNFDH